LISSRCEGGKTLQRRQVQGLYRQQLSVRQPTDDLIKRGCRRPIPSASSRRERVAGGAQTRRCGSSDSTAKSGTTTSWQQFYPTAARASTISEFETIRSADLAVSAAPTRSRLRRLSKWKYSRTPHLGRRRRHRVPDSPPVRKRTTGSVDVDRQQKGRIRDGMGRAVNAYTAKSQPGILKDPFTGRMYAPPGGRTSQPVPRRQREPTRTGNYECQVHAHSTMQYVERFTRLKDGVMQWHIGRRGTRPDATPTWCALPRRRPRLG